MYPIIVALLAIAIALLLLLLAHRIWPAALRFRRCYKFAQSLRGPSLLDLVRATRRGHILDWLADNHRRYGACYRIWFGFDLSLQVNDPDLVRTILSSNELTHKARGYDLVRPWLGNGLLTNGGEAWHARRKLLTPAFHFRILGTFKEPMEECCDVLVQRLRAVADGERAVDVYQYVTLFALDVICETAMGIKVNAQINQESQFVRATQEICRIFHRQLFSTWKRIPFLFSLSADGSARDAALRILHGETRRVIQLRRSQLDNEPGSPATTTNGDDAATATAADNDDFTGNKRRLAFLDSLLLAQRDGGPLSDAHIQEEVDTFMFEGHDTTSSAISFALYLLSQHAGAQRAARAEVLRTGGMLDANTSLPYLEAVIKETLRLYPSVPSYSRQVKGQPFQLGELSVPVGTTIAVMAYMVHRDPELFAQPERFWPKRFLDGGDVDGYEDGDEAAPPGGRSTHPYASVAFSAGPRNCIGQRFAMLELKCTLSRLVREFEWLPVEGFVPHNVPELVLKSANGVMVRMRQWQQEEQRG